MKKVYIIVIISILIISIGIYLFSNQNNEKEAFVNTANDIMINASDFGVGGEYRSHGGYINDPAGDFAKLYEQFNWSDDDPKLKLPKELSNNGVKDGYILYLSEIDDNNNTISLSVVTVFVFNDIKGAKNFFDYNKNRFTGIFDVSGVGDKAIISENKRVLVVRYSNVVIEVDTHSIKDKEATSKDIAKEIINKIKSQEKR